MPLKKKKKERSKDQKYVPLKVFRSFSDWYAACWRIIEFRCMDLLSSLDVWRGKNRGSAMTRTHVTFGGFTQSCKQNACVLPDRREREKEKACFTSSHAMWSRACTRNLLLPLPAIDDIALTIYWENIHRPPPPPSAVFPKDSFFSSLSLPSSFGEVPL